MKYRFAMGRDWPGGLSRFFSLYSGNHERKDKEKSEEKRTKETTIFFWKTVVSFCDPLGFEPQTHCLKGNCSAN